eukprot:Phypoly_transcript_14590.p1 GENE.Phypoly_transcript_14590~~Phypoly_transcript_14590.p1  ORF type:complete len:192 (+),score=18.33 Phypoly_transcript_14590:386-961(+)
MQKSIFFTLSLFVALSCAQYAAVAYYPITSNCTGVPYRTSYTQNTSCTPSACYEDPSYQLAILTTCVKDIPQTPGTLDVYSYTGSHNCSGSPNIGAYSLNNCIPDERGNYGYFSCSGQYICSDAKCTNCTMTPFSTTCTNTTLDSTEYKCYPSVPTSTTSSSTTHATTSPASTIAGLGVIALSCFMAIILL